jgi:hypothetical protein
MPSCGTCWFKPAITTILAPTRILLAQVWLDLVALCKTNELQTRNHQLLDGEFTSFIIVPFNDGSMPTEAPVSSPSLDSWNSLQIVHTQHNLLALVNVAAIRALTVPQTTAYAAGYGLGNIRATAERRKAIGRAVGCTVEVIL